MDGNLLGFAVLLYSIAGTSGAVLNNIGMILVGRVLLGLGVTDIYPLVNAISNLSPGIAHLAARGTGLARTPPYRSWSESRNRYYPVPLITSDICLFAPAPTALANACKASLNQATLTLGRISHSVCPLLGQTNATREFERTY